MQWVKYTNGKHTSFRRILITILLTLILSVQSISVFAADNIGLLEKDEVVQAAKLTKLRDGMMTCYDYGLHDNNGENWGGGRYYPRINSDNAGSGKWFNEEYKPITGVSSQSIATTGAVSFYTKDSLSLKCQELVNAFIKEAGWANGIEAICALGFVRDEGDGCTASDQQFMPPGNPKEASAYRNGFLDKINAKIDERIPKNPNTNGAIEYLENYRWAIKICEASDPAVKGTHSPDLQKTIDNKRGIVLKTFNSDKQIIDVEYLTKSSPSRNCLDIVNKANANVDFYKNFIGNSTITDKDRAGAAAGASQNNTATNKQCNIPGIGWLLCPIVTFLANVADNVYGLISEQFLQIDTRMTTNQGAKRAWEAMRNIANVMFVIAFIFVIYSQITGLGISNYGIKKILPRLVIVAIAVNLSFIICGILVDASNMAGVSLVEILRGAADSIAGKGAVSFNRFNMSASIVAILSLGAVGYALFAFATVIIVTAVVSFLTFFILLIVRQVLLLILIVISPIAIVFLLLPNTEGIYKKWSSLFIKLLLLFPIISLLYGGGYLAKAIINSTGAVSDQINSNINKP